MDNTLYFVVPCYNEREVLRDSAGQILKQLEEMIASGKVSDKSGILFVNDGSNDGTWEIITDLCRENSRFAGLSLSRNRGHQNALLAGLMAARRLCDMTISIDADMQDDLTAADKMVDAYLEGCDVVYGVRARRNSDSFFKRVTAEGYYRLLTRLGCEIVFNHADYRLLSARALSALHEYREQRIFLRGVTPMLGYKTALVEYDRRERLAGVSKYTVKKMLSLASDGAVSLTLRPLRAITITGLVTLTVAAALTVYLIIRLIANGGVSGWLVSAVSTWIAAGLVILSLGIVGEYVGRTYMESKGRPRYNIDKTAGLGDDFKGDINMGELL